MSQTNGHSRSRRQQLRAARERAELRRLQLEESLLETLPFSFAGWAGGVPNDWTYTDAHGRPWLPLGTGGNLSARKDGSYRPFVWTEPQLDWERARARWLVTENPLAAGICTRLATFTVRTGYSYEAQPTRRHRKDAAAVQLADLVQQVVDEFVDLNNFSEMELECALRDPCDGEVFIRSFGQNNGTTLARFIEPEQIRQPLGSPHNWLYGKESAPADVVNTRSYAVCYDPDRADDWEQVDAADVSEIKANTPSTVKRGISDFHAGTAEMIEGAWKLLTAMRTGATISACIPWIEQFEAGAAAVSGNIGATKNLNFPTGTHPITGREQNFRQFQPGEILKVGKGRQYLPPPLAANTSNYIATEQACLRAIGQRWDMPEYMVSGDASNANYASTLVAGSPFVIAIELRQARLKRLFLRVLWVAIRNAAQAGKFVVNGQRYGAEDVQRLVDVQATPPAVAIANKAEEATVDHQDIAAGVMSKKTRRAKIGLDDEQEKSNIAEEPPTPPLPAEASRGQEQTLGNRPPGPIGEGRLVECGDAQALAEEVKAWLLELAKEAGEELTLPSDEEICEALRAHLDGISEGCEPNKNGPGHHDTETGHPCSPGGQEGASDTGADTLPPEKKGIVARVKAKVAEKFNKMVQKYGKKGAIAVVAAMAALTPVPLPGTSLIPVLVAESVLAVKRLVAGASKPTAARESRITEYTYNAEGLIVRTVERLVEVKDASGHEHGADGRFGSGGNGKRAPAADDLVHSYLDPLNDPEVTPPTAKEANEINRELKADGSKFRVVPDGRGKWVAMHVADVVDEFGVRWGIFTNPLTGATDVGDRDAFADFKKLSGDENTRAYLHVFNDPQQKVTDEDAQVANKELEQDGSPFRLEYDELYSLWVAKQVEGEK